MVVGMVVGMVGGMGPRSPKLNSYLKCMLRSVREPVGSGLADFHSSQSAMDLVRRRTLKASKPRAYIPKDKTIEVVGYV